MNSIGLYPGSFNPWHEGHADIVKKALKLFDRIIIAQGINPDKKGQNKLEKTWGVKGNIVIDHFSGLLVDYIEYCRSKMSSIWQVSAIIRGLRNGHDLQYEMNQQYWNEDLGLKIPVVYFITNRMFAHISSSAIRQINHFRE